MEILLSIQDSVFLRINFHAVQTVKNLPVTQKTRVQSLGWEVPLEKGMTIHSSILAWRIPQTEEPSRVMALKCFWNRISPHPEPEES